MKCEVPAATYDALWGYFLKLFPERTSSRGWETAILNRVISDWMARMSALENKSSGDPWAELPIPMQKGGSEGRKHERKKE